MQILLLGVQIQKALPLNHIPLASSDNFIAHILKEEDNTREDFYIGSLNSLNGDRSGKNFEKDKKFMLNLVSQHRFTISSGYHFPCINVSILYICY